MMKNKKRKNKAILIVALILCITIGYAALATTLNITGNSEIKNARWDIHFDNLVVDSSSVEATTPATIDSNKTTINYGVHLAKPGDIYAFTVDVVNEGTIDGMISVVSNTGLTTEQQKYVDYSITYDGNTQLQLKDGLKAGDKKNIKVIVKYKDDINPGDLPQEEATIDLTLKVDYVQADDTVREETGVFMKSYTFGSTDDYHNRTYKSKVTKIVTKTNIDVPETAIEQWDVSAAGDGSVIAYIEDDGSGNGTYKVTIGGDGGKIIANEDCVLFPTFSSLKEVDLSNLDTSKVTNMREMFYDCESLTSLDLSKWDTSKVTDMSYMFYMCGSLANIDANKLNTANVTDMSYMFQDCSSLDGLDISKWDIGKVTNMKYMFCGCTSLTNIGVLDTSNVNNVEGLFTSCTKLIVTITIRKNSDFDMIPTNSSIATEPGSQITLNYTSSTSEVVSQYISYFTTSTNRNVVKGSLVS